MEDRRVNAERTRISGNTAGVKDALKYVHKEIVISGAR